MTEQYSPNTEFHLYQDCVRKRCIPRSDCGHNPTHIINKGLPINNYIRGKDESFDL